MILKPIIPIFIVLIVCIGLLIYIITSKKRIFDKILSILIIVMLFIINLRPMIPVDRAKIYTNNLNVLFVIDTTHSMNAEDYKLGKPRFDGVKADCKYIVDELAGANFALIKFDDKAKRLLPYSNDADLMISEIDSLKVMTSRYAKGSNMNIPLEEIKKLYKDNSSNSTLTNYLFFLEDEEESKKNKNKKNIIFFISDGENTEEIAVSSEYKEIKKYIDDGAVLGYGTTKGGKMKEEYSGYVDNPDYKSSERYAISKIDENNLKNIASMLGVNYYKMDKQDVIKPKVKEIIESANIYGKNGVNSFNYNDIYFYFVIPLFGLLIAKYIYIKRSI